MKHAFATPVLTLIVMLATGVTRAGEPVPATTDNPDQGFTYHDDWAIVSAPPPPGPYQGVNIDPRIPGQENSAGSPMMPRPMQQADRMMERFMNVPPPAAGQSTIPPRQPVQAARQQPPRQHYRPQYLPQEYGHGYGSRMPVPGAYPPAVTRDWGHGPDDRMEERVPTPAEYDRTTAPPPGPFGQPGSRY